MRLAIDEENEPIVPLSPLIDCVFLLLIFFLVTTMMKKWEMQIPLDLPPITSSLSSQRSAEDAAVIALGTDGKIYQVVTRDAYSGETTYAPIADLPAYLASLRSDRGADLPLEIAAERDIPVESVVEVFDMCQLQGFKHTRVRLGGRPNETGAAE